MKARIVLSITLIALSLTSVTFAADREPPAMTEDGLYLIEGTRMARVYAKPEVDLSAYNRIYLVKPVVSFIKDWKRQQNQIPNRTVTSEDMQRIKADLADLFMEVFRQELQDKGGYQTVEEAADDVLVVRPAIVHLNVVAPYSPRNPRDRSAIASAGAMTLYMELLDSVTGDKLVMAIDNKYDRTLPSNFRSDQDRNEQAARELLGEWAELLRLALDEARTVVKGD
mgnify:CR=1 FL=1